MSPQMKKCPSDTRCTLMHHRVLLFAQLAEWLRDAALFGEVCCIHELRFEFLARR
jgi:hypothetical protein